jgi:hypothetical protein
MTADEIIAEVRAMLATLPDLPFKPSTSIVDLPPHVAAI